MSDFNSSAHIIFQKLEPQQWAAFKTFRLHALKSDPQAFLIPYSKEIKITDEEWKSRLNHYQGDDAIMLFAKDDGAIVGMVGAYWDDANDTKMTAHIFNVYVIKEYRGRHIGRLLMENILNSIKGKGGIQKVLLQVNNSDTAPLNLYKSIGFQEVSTKRVVTATGKFEDKVVLEIHL